MKNFIKSIYWVLFCLIPFNSFCQTDSITYDDRIKLNNGYIVKCKIIEITANGLLISTPTKKNFELEQSRIKLVVQNENILFPKSNIVYFDQDRKLFGQVNFGASFGNADQGLLTGRNIEALFRYKLINTHGGHYLRLNLGQGSFEAAQKFSLLSTGLGYEFVFNNKKVSPFVHGNIGYGFNVRLNDDYQEINNITREVKTKGSTNYELGVGLLFRSEHGYAYTLGATFLYQPASIDVIYSGEWGWRNQFEMQLRRTFLKFGFIF